MSTHAHEALVRRLFEEVWNRGSIDTARELIHDDYRSAENITFASLRGPDVLAADIAFYREQYADLHFELEQVFSHGELVVATWRASGVAQHELFTDRAGRERQKSLAAEGVSLSRIADGKIIESRLYWPRHPLFP